MCDPINSVIFSLFFFFFFAFFQQFFFLLLQLFLSDNTHTRSSFKKHSCRSCLFLVDCSFFSLLFVSQSFIHKGSHSLICTSILLFACRMFPCSPKYLLIFLIAVSSSSWVWCFGAPPGDDFCTLFPGFRVFLVFWTLSRDTFRTILCRHPWFSWILLCFSYSSCINILGFRVQLLGFQVQRSKVFRVYIFEDLTFGFSIFSSSSFFSSSPFFFF